MKYVLMDLDGTITDPKIGITKAVQYALKSFGITVEDLDSLCKYIGPPLRDSFADFYGFDKEQTEEAVIKYREYYKDIGIYENHVYTGMEELLQKLRAEGMRLIVATSKPESFARRILEHFGLSDYYEDICGDTMDNARATKEAVIRYALEKNNITDYSEVVMVGDRMHDMIGAKAVGLTAIGVLYGYGSREELEETGADWIARTVEEIYPIITNI